MNWGNYLSKKLFSYVHGNHLVYNQCWEDPRLDREALQFKNDDNVVMITSAGCNALDYALTGVQAIHAIDLNPRQNALLELKIVGIKRLEFEDFFKIFGDGYCENFRALYKDKLRPHLSEEARQAWDDQIHFFDKSFLFPSFYFRGSAGLFARLLRYNIDQKQLRPSIARMFECESMDEQRRLYFLAKETFWNNFSRWLFKQETLIYLLGVPRPQFAQIQNVYPGGMPQFVEDGLEQAFAHLPLQDNYFWWLYFNGSYSKERCPEYLKEENFNKLKNGMVDVIHTYTGSLLDFLKKTDKKISKFVLLDHMDWLHSEHQDIMQQEWQAIVDKAAKNARAIWRSAGLKVDFIDPIQVKVNGHNKSLGSVLHYHTELAAHLHKKDRVHTYGSFYIADIQV